MTFPVMKVDEIVYAAGLCGVCRAIVKNAGKSYEYLLGFKQSCLSAPAEVSPWTKFCEVDVVECTRSVLSFHHTNHDSHTLYTLPKVIACFESHLGRAPRQHNKWSHTKNRPVTSNKTTMDDIESQVKAISLKSADDISRPNDGEMAPLPQFMEGDTISIADLVVFPGIWMIITTMANNSSGEITEMLPLICEWMERVKSSYRSIEFMSLLIEPAKSTAPIKYTVESISDFSLYKREPKGQRAKSRKFTKQNELDQAIRKLAGMDIATTASYNSSDRGNVVHSLNWTDIPVNVLPETDQIPESRLERKREQLLCLAKEVAELSTSGDVIVDFCSGAGHLGILIAHQLKDCFIILLENKEESALRAKERVNLIGLQNIAIFQCNIDYLSGQFDVGTSLHACGVATDIVIMQSLKRKAKFVCCPCCYGGCVETPDISYPRSKFYRSYDITANDYKYLSHAADQAHELSKTQNAEKSLQGMACMDYVDTDRKLYAEECGYVVKLTRLYPENCTPKNRLLIGSIDKCI